MLFKFIISVGGIHCDYSPRAHPPQKKKKPSYAYAHLHKKKKTVFSFQVSPRSHQKHTYTYNSIQHICSCVNTTRQRPGDLRHCVQTIYGDHPDSSPVVNRRFYAEGGGWGANQLDPEAHLHLVLSWMVLYLHHPWRLHYPLHAQWFYRHLNLQHAEINCRTKPPITPLLPPTTLYGQRNNINEAENFFTLPAGHPWTGAFSADIGNSNSPCRSPSRTAHQSNHKKSTRYNIIIRMFSFCSPTSGF